LLGQQYDADVDDIELHRVDEQLVVRRAEHLGLQFRCRERQLGEQRRNVVDVHVLQRRRWGGQRAGRG
jgi:hypothetical protein